MLVTVLSPIDSQPLKRGIYDFLVEQFEQRWHARYLATGQMLFEHGLNFTVKRQPRATQHRDDRLPSPKNQFGQDRNVSKMVAVHG